MLLPQRFGVLDGIEIKRQAHGGGICDHALLPVGPVIPGASAGPPQARGDQFPRFAPTSALP